jgi:hypothetical protein
VEDGSQDRGGQFGIKQGRKAVVESLGSPANQEAISGGLAHFSSLPFVSIDGDEAVVTSYLQILTPMKGEPVEVPNYGTSTGFRVHRVVTNRWELVRTPEGWKFKHRTIRLCDGSEPARQILRRALEPSIAAAKK